MRSINDNGFIAQFMDNTRFEFSTIEPLILNFWKEAQIYCLPLLETKTAKTLFLIDTPPPYANGPLHHGHGMSYTHIDIIARWHRMQGEPTLLPLCFDDNGLPTEKYTEKKYHISPQLHPPNFYDLCKSEADASIKIQIQQLERFGFSYNHQISYRTIDDTCARLTQQNFLDLYAKGLISRTYEPQLFCTSCQTALSQADLETTETTTSLYYIKFPAENLSPDRELIIATTRPEFLPACSAIFYHPSDSRYNTLKPRIFNPWNHHELLFLPDDNIDKTFGSGLMMCCTFGNQEDILYYRKHQLPLINLLQRDGTLSEIGGNLAGLTCLQARELMIKQLTDNHLLLPEIEPLTHMISTCERCHSPAEIILSWQWTLDILSTKQHLLELAQQLHWYPEFMIKRLERWIEGLRWNWTISRQRYYGIPIPLWYCNDCRQIILPLKEELPIDPRTHAKFPCPRCHSLNITPESNIFDTWMTSSLSPRILHEIYRPSQPFQPFALRPQAHEIIRTWGFYTLFKEMLASDNIPWQNIMISGWGLGFHTKGKRQQKASKSGGGGIDPQTLCEEYGADAFRYWAAQARSGRDQYLHEDMLLSGKKLITKLYNATRIILQLLTSESLNDTPIIMQQTPSALEPETAAMTTRLQTLIHQYAHFMSLYNYTDALKELETTFWRDFCSTYIEQLKKAKISQPLSLTTQRQAYTILKTFLQLFAPFFPFITEYLWAILWRFTPQGLPYSSIHNSLLSS